VTGPNNTMLNSSRWLADSPSACIQGGHVRAQVRSAQVVHAVTGPALGGPGSLIEVCSAVFGVVIAFAPPWPQLLRRRRHPSCLAGAGRSLQCGQQVGGDDRQPKNTDRQAKEQAALE